MYTDVGQASIFILGGMVGTIFAFSQIGASAVRGVIMKTLQAQWSKLGTCKQIKLRHLERKGSSTLYIDWVIIAYFLDIFGVDVDVDS